MTEFDHERTERLLNQLLAGVADQMSSAESTEVRDFIEVGEFGLALETLVDIFFEEQKDFPPQHLSLLAELAESMNMDLQGFKEKLRLI